MKRSVIRSAGDASPGVSDYENIWKLRILNRALWVVFAGSVGAIGLWIFRRGGFDKGALLGGVFTTLVFASLHPRFSWRFKAVILIFDFTLVGMYFPSITGPRFGPLCLAGAGCIVVAAFFGRLPAYLLALADFAGIMAYGILAHLGWLKTLDIPLPGEAAFMTWFQAGIVFLAANTVLVMMVDEIVRSLAVSIERLKRQHAISKSLALYDNLTGLPNRKLFQDRLQHAMAASARDLQYGAVFFIDVDNFKNINDTSGHASGDYFLTTVAERLSDVIKPTDTAARWGGDEFVVIAENLSISLTQAGQAAEKIGEKILEAINVPIANPYAKGQSYQNSVSIGITLMYGHIHSADELLKRADIAMYQAKVGGKNRLRNFDVDMQKQVEERLALEADLKQALRKSEFELHFQPQYNSQHKVFGAEILLRWRHATRGMIFPGDFIPLAEETGDIIEIGKWVIRMACLKLQEWGEQDTKKHLVLAINVSPKQFREPGFAEMVRETVRQSGITPAALKLELTESLMLENVDETIQKMEQLKGVGVGFSLDDFGTGYSSLAYLKRLPFSQLKIDQSFVRDMTSDKNDAILIRTIIGMAANLNLQVIAEGVETPEQLGALSEMGCHAYQGFHFSRPVPLAEFENLLLL